MPACLALDVVSAEPGGLAVGLDSLVQWKASGHARRLHLLKHEIKGLLVLKDNAAILLDALRKKYGPPRLSKEYGRLLYSIAKDRGLTDIEIGRIAGLKVNKSGDASITRLRNGPSATLAWKLYRALVDAGAKVPTPVLGADDELLRWSVAGASIAASNRDHFLAMLDDAEGHAAALKQQPPSPPVLGGKVRIGAETDPLPRDRSEKDRPQAYAGRDGQQSKGTVDPPRKPAPRRGP